MTVICKTLRDCLKAFLVLKQGEMSTPKQICTHFWRFRSVPDELHSSQWWEMLNHYSSRGNRFWKHLGSVRELSFKNQGSLQARTCPQVLGEAAGQRARGKLVAHLHERADPSAAWVHVPLIPIMGIRLKSQTQILALELSVWLSLSELGEFIESLKTK